MYLFKTLLVSCFVVLVECFSPQFNYKIGRDISYSLGYVFLMIALTALTELTFRRLKLTLSPYLFILLIGVAMGIANRFYFFYVFVFPNRYMLVVALPALVLKTSFSVDAHTYFRSWAQIAIISIPGVILMSCTIGLVVYCVMSQRPYWNFTGAVLFGTLFVPIYPFQLIKSLKELGQHTKHVVNLLEGESIFGLCTVIIIWDICQGIYLEDCASVWCILKRLATLIPLGVVCGYIFGKIVCAIIKGMFGHNKEILLWTIGAAYFIYYLGNIVITTSGMLCLIIMAFLLSIERPAMAPDVDIFLGQFWELCSCVIQTTLMFTHGVWVGNLLIDHTAFDEWGLMFVTCCVAILSRIVVFLMIGPCLTRIGYGITWNNLVILAWGGQRSLIPICISTIVAEKSLLSQELGRQLIVHTSGLLLLTLLVQVSLIKSFLKFMGVADISAARQRNMAICVKHLQYRQMSAICCLKMEKFLSDCNWPMINSCTSIKNPYNELAEITSSDTDFYEYRTTECPDCEKEVVEDPSPEVMAEMIREARIRVLKAQKISFLRQYENGMISRDGRRVLLSTVQIASESKNAVLDLEALHRLFVTKSLSDRIKLYLLRLIRSREIGVRRPNTYVKRKCYHIARNRCFTTLMYIVIVINAISTIAELSISMHETSPEFFVMGAINSAYFLMYLLECYVKVYGYSRKSVKDGFRIYFQSLWNIFDFCMLIVAFGDLIVWILNLSVSWNIDTATSVTRVTTLLRIIRLIRICHLAYPKISKYYKMKMDGHIAFAYEIGKSFVDAQTEVIDKLPQIIDNKKICDDMATRMEQDRSDIIHRLGLVQKDTPWITITVKTRQAMRTTLYNMNEAINDLKISGWMDDFEHDKLSKALKDRLKFVNAVKSVSASEPKMIFKEVTWMGHNEIYIDFLYQNSKLITVDTNDNVCTEKLLSDGIFIIVTGLLKLIYTPRRPILNLLQRKGLLPIVDYVTNLTYKDKMEDYLVCGNSFGELSTLTDRPYNCHIVPETPSQLFLIPREIIKEAMQVDDDPIYGLECRLWKCLGVRIGLSILMEVTAYRTMTVEKIKMALERSFIPRLTNHKAFLVNEMIEDIILIEGIVKDAYTNDTYIAPIYIPRTIKKLSLNVGSDGELSKLLIIPLKDVDAYDLLSGAEMTSELNPSSITSSCLLHSIQDKISTVKSKSKITAFRRMTLAGNLGKPIALASESSHEEPETLSIRKTRTSLYD